MNRIDGEKGVGNGDTPGGNDDEKGLHSTQTLGGQQEVFG